jgi:peptidoglycan/LPS O-acetylase OafA/YrhL
MVLADHLGTRLTGGYVGVDVFFVISGYLIGSSILTEMREERFTILGFYERRVRRIFPAMLAMLFVSTALAYRYYVPSEVEGYAKSLLAALGSVSNLLFWHSGSYFDQPGLKPLLHTWSLAVEEQFYILFPILLVLVRRWIPQKLGKVIVGIAALSFLSACLLVPSHRPAAFFFAPSRAWELMVGAILSLPRFPRLRGAFMRNAASLLGIVCILVPGWTYDASTAFPGMAALPPCLGAAMIIAAGELGPTLVGRVLGWRPVTFIGLISYSLYLWHWPIIVFHGPGEGRGGKAMVALASLVLGALSWGFIESPFRTGKLRPGRRSLFAICGGASLALAGCAIAMLWTHGMRFRFPPDAQKVAAYMEYEPGPSFRAGTCFITLDDTFAAYRKDQCLGQGNGHESILLAGDSHAAMLWAGLSTVFPERDWMQATATDCAPLVVSARVFQDNCRNLLHFIFKDYLVHHRPDVLLLEGRWRESDMPGIGATIDLAQSRGIRVVLIGPAIEYDLPEPRIAAVALRDGQPDEVREHMLNERRVLDREMAELARSRWHVSYISFFDNLCHPDCPVYATAQVPLLFDMDHMTSAGSMLFARSVREHGELP